MVWTVRVKSASERAATPPPRRRSKCTKCAASRAGSCPPPGQLAQVEKADRQRPSREKPKEIPGGSLESRRPGRDGDHFLRSEVTVYRLEDGLEVGPPERDG